MGVHGPTCAVDVLVFEAYSCFVRSTLVDVRSTDPLHAYLNSAGDMWCVENGFRRKVVIRNTIK